MVVFGQRGCTWAKVVVYGQIGCNWANWLYFGQNWLSLGKVVVLG